jgi:butyrate kinase
MAYQIGKDIGAMAAVLQGRIDGIILTGGIAHSSILTDAIKKYIEFLSPVFVYPGEDEMTALAEGGLRAIMKQEETKKY